MELDECSAEAMTKYIVQATERLKCDFAWLASAKNTNCKRPGQMYSKVPTVLVFGMMGYPSLENGYRPMRVDVEKSIGESRSTSFVISIS